MIAIYLNDTVQHIDPTHTLQDLLTHNNHCTEHFAVAINNQLIPRINYKITKMQAGDRIDIIVPMQGG
jgi:sulfur carrier protein